MTPDWDRERVGRTRGAAIAGALAIGFGAATGTATALLACVPVVGFVLYDRLTTVSPPDVEYDRDVGRGRPLPGDDVTVTVTVRNVGDANAPDLRVVDGVPEGLAVVEGSPRAALSIPAGGSASFSYAVRARRGTHEFDPSTVVARNLTGSARARAAIEAESTIECRVRGEAHALDDRPSSITGALDTAEGGAGVEFHSLREYDSADPANRIDWRRLAAGGDLATIRYREANAAFVQFVVDRRPATDSAFDAGRMTHRETATYATELLSETLLDEGHYVGLTAYGERRNHVLPANGSDQWLRLQRRFERMTTDASGEPTSSESPATEPVGLADELASLLPSYAQFTLVSPLFDDEFVAFARRLQAHGRAVVVIAPRPPTATANGQRLMLADRALRIDELRRHDVTVLDWNADDPLPFALERRFGVST